MHYMLLPLYNKGRTYNLGRFLSEQDAADAVARFRAEHMPFSSEGRSGV